MDDTTKVIIAFGAHILLFIVMMFSFFWFTKRKGETIKEWWRRFN